MVERNIAFLLVLGTCICHGQTLSTQEKTLDTLFASYNNYIIESKIIAGSFEWPIDMISVSAFCPYQDTSLITSRLGRPHFITKDTAFHEGINLGHEVGWYVFDGIRFSYVKDKVNNVYCYSSQFVTPDGIRVGMSLNDLKAILSSLSFEPDTDGFVRLVPDPPKYSLYIILQNGIVKLLSLQTGL